jgi:hypothetical protein
VWEARQVTPGLNESKWRAPRLAGLGGQQRSTQMGVEPGQGAFDYVAAVLGAREHVALVFVDYELGFYAEGFEGVPEFVGLRGGDFAVAIAN